MVTPTLTRKPKRGELVAEQIQRKIVENGWPVGTSLGTEADLMAQLGVARATFREAVRQLERVGIASMRRGARGGLVVAEPARTATVRAMASYLEFSGVSWSEMYEARSMLYAQAARIACARMDDPGIARLRDLDDALDAGLDPKTRKFGHLEILSAVADLSGNPVLALYIEALNHFAIDQIPADLVETPQGSNSAEARRSVHKIVQAIVSGDAGAAQEAVRADTDARRRQLEHMLQSYERHARAEASDERGKTGERLALRMANEIQKNAWPPGTRLGLEPELVQRYGVSQPIFRQAVRLLELHALVRMKTGHGSGLVVGAPDPAYTIAAAGDYLRHMGLSSGHYLEIRQTLGLGVTPLAAERAEDFAGLIAAHRNEDQSDGRDFFAASLGFHGLIADLGGNRALSLFTHILLRLRLQELATYPAPNALSRARLRASHQRILEALLARDPPLARRRMIEHFGVIDVRKR